MVDLESRGGAEGGADGATDASSAAPPPDETFARAISEEEIGEIVAALCMGRADRAAAGWRN